MSNVNQGFRMLHILVCIACPAIALAIKVMHVVNNTSSQNPTTVNSIVSATSIHALDMARDKRLVALAGVIIAIAMDLIDTYMETNILTFVSCLVVAVLGMGICAFAFVTSHSCEMARQVSSSSKLFAVMSFILKHLLKDGIIPVVAKDWHNVQEALFVASFAWSTLALWLQAIGIPILNPVRHASCSFARKNWSSLVASILYWAAGILVVVNVTIIAAVSPAGTPVVAKVAGIVFAICTTAVVCTLSNDWARW